MRPLGNLLLPSHHRTLQVGQDQFRAGRLALLVWAVSVASSTHVALVPYRWFRSGWWAGMRVLPTGLRGPRGESSAGRASQYPRPLHAALAATVVVALAVPVFVTMPRLRSPLVAGVGGARAVSGFSLGVDLSAVGAIEVSREIALVLRATQGERISEGWTRLRATALQLTRPGVWESSRSRRVRLPDAPEGHLWLEEEHELPLATVELEVDLLRPEAYIFVPQGAVALQAEGRHALNESGGVMVSRADRHPQSYRAWVSSRPVSYGSRPAPEDLFVPSPTRGSNSRDRSPEGSSRPEDKAAAVVAICSERAATRPRAGHLDGDPVAWFLLDAGAPLRVFRRAMVVLLRSLGMPAR
jgi:hypothetical protein